MIKLSKAGKMPCPSWSLPAYYSCPGSVWHTEEYSGREVDFAEWHGKTTKDSLVGSCKGCYALEGNYNFPNVKNVREHNMEDWKRDDWVSDMVKLIKHEPYFRFFDSGDLYCVELVDKIYQVCKRCPNTQFWIPTLTHKIGAIHSAIRRKLDTLPNVNVRRSAGSIKTSGDMESELNFPAAITRSAIVRHEDIGKDFTKGKSILVCQAFKREGKCGDCRACWNKDIKLILYPVHGKRLTKQAKEMVV